jgi:hypothetical protein
LHYVLLKVSAPEVSGLLASRIQLPILETLVRSIPEKTAGLQDTNFLFETQLLSLLRTSISLAVPFPEKHVCIFFSFLKFHFLGIHLNFHFCSLEKHRFFILKFMKLSFF